MMLSTTQNLAKANCDATRAIFEPGFYSCGMPTVNKDLWIEILDCRTNASK
jgi:hypothetical protein